ncbi:MAG: heme o synthase [Chlamydiales bacterium]
MSNFISYFKLTKPGIVMGNAITCAGGFMLAAQGDIIWNVFFLVLTGLNLIVGSGCVLNNYFDRHHDAKMARTKNRPLVKGDISVEKALIFAGFLWLIGSGILLIGSNLLTVCLAWAGWVIYLMFYTFLKYHTFHATLVGSIAGGIPPIVGYLSVIPEINGTISIFFLMISFWQMPHFYAISIYRFEEYALASIPVLPVIKGMEATKKQILFYLMGFLGISLLLLFFESVSLFYVGIVVSLGGIWLLIALIGFNRLNDKKWARLMFFCSLAVIIGISLTVPFFYL